MLLSEPDSPIRFLGQQAQHSHPMLFSPWYFGHHPTYLRHLILAWFQQNLPGNLSIVVMPSFLENHPDILALTQIAPPDSTVQFVAITPEEQRHLESRSSGWQRALTQYELIARYSAQLQATHCLLMHLDSCLLPLVLGRKLPCDFSGIYFRPTFHYGHTSSHTQSGLTWKERLQQWRERLFLTRLLAHPQLQTLFCLDPLAVAPINQLNRRGQLSTGQPSAGQLSVGQPSAGQATAVHLPDPVCLTLAPESEVERLRQSLEIEPDRTVCLAFGSLAEGRKGTQQLLEALQLLPLPLCQKLCLLLVGEPFPERQALLETWLAPLRQTLPVQIITRFGYLPESEVPLFFQLSDAVLAPYQKHAGMSGILLQAAVAQKPILSSNYGLMGELVQHYDLGLAVDTTVPSELAGGMAQLLAKPTIGDPRRMQQFAELNSVAKFTQTIFEHIYSRS